MWYGVRFRQIQTVVLNPSAGQVVDIIPGIRGRFLAPNIWQPGCIEPRGAATARGHYLRLSPDTGRVGRTDSWNSRPSWSFL